MKRLFLILLVFSAPLSNFAAGLVSGIQSGTNTSSADGTFTNVFASPFAAIPIVTMTPVNASPGTNTVVSVSVSQFVGSVGQPATLVNWIAVGPVSSSGGVKVSQLPFTNSSPPTALMIVDQPYPGRTTNDTFTTTLSNIFNQFGGSSLWATDQTNLWPTNLLWNTFLGASNSLPNFSFPAVLNIRGMTGNPALLIDTVQTNSNAALGLFSVADNGLTGPQSVVYLQSTTAHGLGNALRVVKIDAFGGTLGGTNSPIENSAIAGTVGLYSDASAPNTNTVNAGLIGGSDGRGFWNLGTAGIADQNSFNSQGNWVGVYGREWGTLGASQNGAGGFFELRSSTDTTNTILGETAAIIADNRNTGKNLFVGRSTWQEDWFTIGPTGQLIFGPGDTNVLSRTNGVNMVFDLPASGGDPSGLFIHREGNVPVYFGETTAGGALVQSASNRVILDVGGTQAFWDGSNFAPASTGNIGTLANPWQATWLPTNGVVHFGTNQLSTDGANHPTWNGQVIAVP